MKWDSSVEIRLKPDSNHIDEFWGAYQGAASLPAEVATRTEDVAWVPSSADVVWVEGASSIRVQDSRRIRVRVTTRAVMRTGLENKAFIRPQLSSSQSPLSTRVSPCQKPASRWPGPPERR